MQLDGNLDLGNIGPYLHIDLINMFEMMIKKNTSNKFVSCVEISLSLHRKLQITTNMFKDCKPTWMKSPNI